MNRTEDYIHKLEIWYKMCDKIIEISDNVETIFIAEELQGKIKNDLIQYRNELKNKIGD